MSDSQKIRFGGRELGSFSIDQLYRMALKGEVDHTAEYWSERQQSWCSLAGIICDLYPSRVAEMKKSGIAKIEILGSGEEDCPSCAALQLRIYPIDKVPALPPEGCTCVPWCRCVEIAIK
jgi:hypothetical protein